MESEAITAWTHVAESAYKASQSALIEERFPATEALQMASEIPSKFPATK